MPAPGDKLAELLDEADDTLLADDANTKDDLIKVLRELSRNPKFRPKVEAECEHLSNVLAKEAQWAAKPVVEGSFFGGMGDSFKCCVEISVHYHQTT